MGVFALDPIKEAAGQRKRIGYRLALSRSDMETVQLALTNVSYAKALRLLLGRNGTCQVVCVEVPDLHKSGVIVVDGTALERLPAALPNPERIVLITHNDPRDFSEAWKAGIVSVVSD